MFNYIQGKLASGLPDSNINAYMNFYSTEERHMFIAGSKVTKTYRIQTQPGGMTMGYAVEACWEPPLVMPVTNPALDFPVSANQSEPYVEHYYINNDQPITKPHTEIKEYPIYCQYDEWPRALVIIAHGILTSQVTLLALEYGRPDTLFGQYQYKLVFGPLSGYS